MFLSRKTDPVVVRKFNPNHGKNGQFSSGAGGSISGASAAAQRLKIEHAIAGKKGDTARVKEIRREMETEHGLRFRELSPGTGVWEKVKKSVDGNETSDVEKFNPHHDKTGRFSSSGAGGSISGGAGKKPYFSDKKEQTAVYGRAVEHHGKKAVASMDSAAWDLQDHPYPVTRDSALRLRNDFQKAHAMPHATPAQRKAKIDSLKNVAMRARDLKDHIDSMPQRSIMGGTSAAGKWDKGYRVGHDLATAAFEADNAVVVLRGM